VQIDLHGSIIAAEAVGAKWEASQRGLCSKRRHLAVCALRECKCSCTGEGCRIEQQCWEACRLEPQCCQFLARPVRIADIISCLWLPVWRRLW